VNPALESFIKNAVKALPVIPGGLTGELEAAIIDIIARAVIKVLERRMVDPQFKTKLDTWLSEESDEEKRSHDLWALMGS
jgi:hypothetical protein